MKPSRSSLHNDLPITDDGILMSLCQEARWRWACPTSQTKLQTPCCSESRLHLGGHLRDGALVFGRPSVCNLDAQLQAKLMWMTVYCCVCVTPPTLGDKQPSGRFIWTQWQIMQLVYEPCLFLPLHILLLILLGFLLHIEWFISFGNAAFVVHCFFLFFGMTFECCNLVVSLLGINDDQ